MFSFFYFFIFLLSSLFLFLILYISVVKTWELLKPFTLFDSHSFTFTVNVLFCLVCAVSTFSSCFCVCSLKTQFDLMRLVNKVLVILVNAASSEDISQQDLYSDFYDWSGNSPWCIGWSLNFSSSVCIWWFCFCPIRAVRFSVCWMNGGFHTIKKNNSHHRTVSVQNHWFSLFSVSVHMYWTEAHLCQEEKKIKVRKDES